MTWCYSPFAIMVYLLYPAYLPATCTVFLHTPLYAQPVSFFIYGMYFAITVFLEYGIYAIFLYKTDTIKKIALYTVLLNLCTHPFIFLILPRIMQKMHASIIGYVLVAEVIAWLGESLLLHYVLRCTVRRSMWIAWWANMWSWGVGTFVAIFLL